MRRVIIGLFAYVGVEREHINLMLDNDLSQFCKTIKELLGK